MFKNLIVFRIKPTWVANLEEAEEKLGEARFVKCGPTQMQSVGWIEPRGQEHGALIESINGHWMVKLCIEKKVVPGSVVKREVEERLDKIEKSTGTRPGKKAAKDIKEEVLLDLLPKAFPKLETVSVWIDPKERLLYVDGGSMGKSDQVVTALVRSLDMGLDVVQTEKSATSCMAEWLLDSETVPPKFSLDRECELKSTGEDKATVKYAHHNLEIEEVKKHIIEGKVPKKLAMTWEDRLSFVLTENGIIKRLSFGDVVFENTSSDDDGFDADFAILTGEISAFLPDVIEALGGELILSV